MAQRKRNPGAIRDLEETQGALVSTVSGLSDQVAQINTSLGVYLTGCIPSNSTGDAVNDLDFSSGFAFSGTRGYTITGMTGKRMDANWAAGNGNGMRAAGSATWGTATDRYLFLLLGATGNFDYGADSVLTASNLLTDTLGVFSVAKRVSALRTTTAAWPTFSAREVAIGTVEYEITPTFQLTKDWTASDDTRQTGTLADAPGGIKVKARMGGYLLDTTSTGQSSAMIVSSLDQADVAPTVAPASFLGQIVVSGTGVTRAAAEVEVETSTVRTFGYRVSNTTTDHSASFCLLGWEDSRA